MFWIWWTPFDFCKLHLFKYFILVLLYSQNGALIQHLYYEYDNNKGQIQADKRKSEVKGAIIANKVLLLSCQMPPSSFAF